MTWFHLLAGIAHHECRVLLRSGFIRIVLLVSLVLAISAGLAGAIHAHALRLDQAQASTKVRQQWLEQPPKNPHSAAHFGMWAFRPTPVMAILDAGADAVLGRALWMEAHQQNDFVSAEREDSILPAGVLRSDVASIFESMTVLVALLLGHFALTREREAMTSEWVRTSCGSAMALAWGKWLGAWLAFCLVWIPLVVLSVLLIASQADEVNWSRIGLWIAVWTVLQAACLGLAIAISARSASSRAALAKVLSLWFILLFTPKLCAWAVSLQETLPNRIDFAQRIEQGLKEVGNPHDANDPKTKAWISQLLTQHGVSDVKDLPFNYSGWALQKGEELTYPVFEREFGRVRAVYREQARWLARLSLVSPTMAVRSLSMALAGTDEEHHFAFADAAEAWRRDMVAVMNHTITYGWTNGDSKREVGNEVWQKVPDLHFEPPTLQQVLMWQVVSLGSLMLFALWSFLVMVLSVRSWLWGSECNER